MHPEPRSAAEGSEAGRAPTLNRMFPNMTTHATPWHRVAALVVYCVLEVGAGMNPQGVAAQPVADERGQPRGTDDVTPSDRGFLALLGRTPERARVIPALWAMHPFEPTFPEVERVRGGGLQFANWYAAVFVNSYDNWSVMAAIERDWYVLAAGWMDFGVGFRAGLMTGYDERLLEIAGDLPALPIAGPLLWVRAGPIGFDALYVYRAISVEGSIGVSR